VYNPQHPTQQIRQHVQQPKGNSGVIRSSSKPKYFCTSIRTCLIFLTTLELSNFQRFLHQPLFNNYVFYKKIIIKRFFFSFTQDHNRLQQQVSELQSDLDTAQTAANYCSQKMEYYLSKLLLKNA